MKSVSSAAAPAVEAEAVRWEYKEGSPSPLGPTWIPSEQAYNFAIYSKYAASVRLLFYDAGEFVTPVFVYPFDRLKNKTGRIWHARIPRTVMRDARYYAYSIDGPPASRHFAAE